MPAILTTIVEGPRDDGKVRYFCEACGRTTNWHPMPTSPTQTVRHYCGMGDRMRLKAMGITPPERRRRDDSKPCVDGQISAMERACSTAIEKCAGEDLREALQAILAEFPKLRRLAVREAQEKRDREDGLA